MFDNTYELTRRQNKYKTMRENVIRMINVLSNSDVVDTLSMAQSSLQSNYLINGSVCKYENIKRQKESISNCISNLRSVLNSIDSKISDIKDDIERAETKENR
jgi:hypothetical protein